MLEMTYTILNQYVFGIRLFENPADISELSEFFYRGTPADAVANEPPVESHKGIIGASLAATPGASPRDSPKELPKAEAKPTIIPFGPSDKSSSDKPSSDKSSCEKPSKRERKPLVTPEDTLFWNVFIAVFGESEFRLIGNKFANREWEEKNRIRQAFVDKPKELQTTNHKITLGNIKEMMSEYMTGKTTILGVVGLAVYYKIPIVLVDEVKKTHLSFLPQNVEHEACVLYKTRAGFRLDDCGTTLETIRETTFGLEGYTRPLRAISTYKRGELNSIAEKCGVDFCDKSKDEVYKALSEYLVWS
jgi:hypothetical protein